MDEDFGHARMAFLLGEASRAAMLATLMDGRAHTATELAAEAEVGASTASAHLFLLVEAGLIVVVRQGRHRYFRIARAEVAATLESLMNLSALAGGEKQGTERKRAEGLRRGPREPRLRFARVCYDHLAGATGVRLVDAMLARGFLVGAEESPVLSSQGEAWTTALGIDLAGLRKARRPIVRPCMDWSERRFHLAGALGAAILARLLESRVLERLPAGRALIVGRRGGAFFESLDPRELTAPHLA